MNPNLITRDKIHCLPDPEAVVIFNHIYKCGGMSLTRMLTSILKPNFFSHHLSILDHPTDLPRYKLLWAHGNAGIDVLLNNARCFYITILRHPLSRCISEYTFTMCRYQHRISKQEDINKYVYSKLQNNILTQFLGCGDRILAEENLFSQYAFYGIMEYYSDSIRELSKIIPELNDKQMTIWNASEQSEIYIDQNTINYFYENNQDDCILYEKALNEFKKRTQNTTKMQGSPEQNNVDLGNVITKNASNKLFTELFNSIAKNAELHKSDEFTANTHGHMALLFYAFNDKEEFFLLHRWLVDRINKNDSLVYWIFQCAKHLADPEDLKLWGERLYDACENLDPGNAVRALVEARLDVAMTLARRTDRSSADFAIRLEAWLNGLRSAPPWQAQALRALALLRIRENRWPDAVELLQEGAGVKPDDLDLRADLCRALLHLGEAGRERAEAEARAALSGPAGTTEPEWALRQLAVTLDAKGDPPGAAEAARRAVRKNPYWGEGWRMLSLACRDTDRDAALSHAEKAVEVAPGSFPCIVHLCDLLQLLGEEDKAMAAAENSLREWPERGGLHIFIAEILKKRGDMEHAVAHAFKAVEADPVAVAHRIFLASLLIQAGRTAEAVAVAHDGMARFPDAGWPHAVFSQALEAENDMPGALAQARLSLAKQPHKRSVAANYARLLRTSGGLDDCEEFCRKALEEDASQGWAWRELCRSAVARGDRQAALHYGGKALEAHPEDMEFRHYVADLKTTPPS